MAPGDSQGGRAGSGPAPEEKGSDAIADTRLPETQERADGVGTGGEDDARAGGRGPFRNERAGLEAVQHAVMQGEDLAGRLDQPGGHEELSLGRAGHDHGDLGLNFGLAHGECGHLGEVLGRLHEPDRIGDQQRAEAKGCVTCGGDGHTCDTCRRSAPFQPCRPPRPALRREHPAKRADRADTRVGPKDRERLSGRRKTRRNLA